MPRRRGRAPLIALMAATAALAAGAASAGPLLFSGSERLSGPLPRSGSDTGTHPPLTAAPLAPAPAPAAPVPPAAPSAPSAPALSAVPAAPSRSHGPWFGTWSAAPTAGVTDTSPDGTPARRTIHNVVHTSIGGDTARITLSNLFGTRPLVVDHAAVDARPVTFRGTTGVTIAAGGQVVSDPVAVPVAADADLVVTLRTRTAKGPATAHPRSHQTSYVEDATGIRRTTDWRYLTAVDVRGTTATGTIAVIGDSLTAGTGSTLDTNSRWPDVLADRLRGRYGVVNAGIAGNRVLRDGTGIRAGARFDRDALDIAGVRTVVVALGINDVQKHPQETDPRRIADALRSLTLRAHARGLRVVGATLMPYEGYRTWSPARDAVRERVNELIRAGGVFDSVIDFDAVTRDPHRPARLLPAYDSGDHLHLNDAGYRRLGSSVDLAALTDLTDLTDPTGLTDLTGLADPKGGADPTGGVRSEGGRSDGRRRSEGRGARCRDRQGLPGRSGIRCVRSQGGRMPS
ncbi:SGNH/GDSL hydrolase family protein [Streptomyces sp. NPDC047987]|uniref:SGNH/GDSL hydrolase family protein n=1 Tax=unclassified Streptomyces TaxID=2593676 RepID=UPI00343E6FEE